MFYIQGRKRIKGYAGMFSEFFKHCNTCSFVTPLSFCGGFMLSKTSSIHIAYVPKSPCLVIPWNVSHSYNHLDTTKVPIFFMGQIRYLSIFSWFLACAKPKVKSSLWKVLKIQKFFLNVHMAKALNMTFLLLFGRRSTPICKYCNFSNS